MKLNHVALNAIKVLETDKHINAQNLANISVPGYRRDLPASRESSFLQALDQFTTRVYSRVSTDNSFSDQPGKLNPTGDNMDISIEGAGYFFIKPENAPEALSRRRDFGVNGAGFLVAGSGHQVLDDSLSPINIPPFRTFVVNELGEIFIEPQNGAPGQRINVGIIGTTLAGDTRLGKSTDGLIRPVGGAELPAADQKAKIAQGYLEASNVSTVEELVVSLETQRRVEMVTKLMETSKQNDESSTEIMGLP